MFLLNLTLRQSKYTWSAFTSQYVSIKSSYKMLTEEERQDFTSQYVSIKSINSHMSSMTWNSLHPNMFLLNRNSTKINITAVCFTSQYVSIKSKEKRACVINWLPLHPNMFLLNPQCFIFVIVWQLFFTSQYVSIKSHTNIIPYFPSLSTPFLSTAPK